MAENSHRDEMNAAIRAQRERHAAPRSLAAEPPPPEPELPPAADAEAVEEQKRRFGFLRRK